MDLSSVVASKFAVGESVVVLLEDAALPRRPAWLQRERILAIVQCGDTSALFVLLSVCFPPMSFLDLTIETVVPIDSNFKCEIDNEVSSLLYLIFSSKNSKLSFELKSNARTSTFVQALYKSMDAAGSSQFAWLDKYGCKKNAEVENSEMFVSRQNIAQGIAPIAYRDSMIKYHIELKEMEYTYLQPFTIFVGTWNVNGQIPPSTLKPWLVSDNLSPPDIYAIGFQELDLSKEAFIFDFTVREAEWYEAVYRSVDPKAIYQKVTVVRLVGMMLIVLIKDQYLNNVKNVAIDTVGTGIMGKMGNKGGVSIRFELHNTSICFINSHLAAHVEEYERRNQDYQEICNRTKFTQLSPPALIKDHHQIYWLGDLNYRITEMDHVTVKNLLKEGNIDAVIKADQLKTQHAANNVLNGYIEGPIAFQPTYKYDPGTDFWDTSEKERAPAWCDRIFWKGDSIQQLSYQSHPELNISDHKPVSALFVSQMKAIDAKKYRKVHEDVIKKLDKLENEFLPHVTVEPTEIIFDTVKYFEPQVREVCIANTGQVPVTFEFIKKLEESSYCKEWLNIEPNIKNINPGEKCDVKLEIFVNNKSAFKLNLGEDKLYDILVLHLEGGKDIFITINGSYEKSCFGTSIETLVHLKAPIRDVLSQKMSDDKLENCTDNVYYREIGYQIPKEIWYLVDHIYVHGLRHSNLFTTPGLHSEQLLIRDWLDYGYKSDIPGSIHSVCDSLILFLESTAEPIIPYNHHYACLNASSNYLQCKQIVMQLPDCKRNVFLYLCAFLQEILKYSSDNGTDVNTLAILFGTTFLRDSPQKKSRPVYERKNVDRNKKASFVEHFLVNDQTDIRM